MQWTSLRVANSLDQTGHEQVRVGAGTCSNGSILHTSKKVVSILGTNLGSWRLRAWVPRLVYWSTDLEVDSWPGMEPNRHDMSA
jgi:hypothetical protein